MGRLALIGGHSILGSEPAAGFEPLDVDTPSGPVRVYERGEQVLLQRHGFDRYTTAARIDHAANLPPLAGLGCDRVLAIGSVGWLRAELGVGSFLCPDDFIALHLGLSSSTTSAAATQCRASTATGAATVDRGLERRRRAGAASTAASTGRRSARASRRRPRSA